MIAASKADIVSARSKKWNPSMAGSLFLLLDDIATVLDDVALMTKVAAKKTAGVLGDDLALNAEQVSGVKAERELPVVWAVFKGSALNKLILVPVALLISAVAPWAITPLLMMGGTYLCFEGAEKIAHKLLHPKDAEADKAALREALAKPEVDLLEVEREKVKGAIRTDFILSAEIIVISLGTVAGLALSVRFGVLAAIATIMTIGVYGLVAGIVKLDDGGMALAKSDNAALRKFGDGILFAAPWLMRFLSFFGTAAMFLVGGGIVAHGIPALHHLEEQWLGGLVAPWDTLGSMTFGGVVGLIVGIVVLLVVEGIKRIRS